MEVRFTAKSFATWREDAVRLRRASPVPHDLRAVEHNPQHPIEASRADTFIAAQTCSGRQTGHCESWWLG